MSENAYTTRFDGIVRQLCLGSAFGSARGPFDFNVEPVVVWFDKAAPPFDEEYRPAGVDIEVFELMRVSDSVGIDVNERGTVAK